MRPPNSLWYVVWNEEEKKSGRNCHYLNGCVTCSNGQILSISSPRNCWNVVSLRAQLQELLHWAITSIPQEHTTTQTDGQTVVPTPVNSVQVCEMRNVADANNHSLCARNVALDRGVKLKHLQISLTMFISTLQSIIICIRSFSHILNHSYYKVLMVIHSSSPWSCVSIYQGKTPVTKAIASMETHTKTCNLTYSSHPQGLVHPGSSQHLWEWCGEVSCVSFLLN